MLKAIPPRVRRDKKNFPTQIILFCGGAVNIAVIIYIRIFTYFYVEHRAVCSIYLIIRPNRIDK